PTSTTPPALHAPSDSSAPAAIAHALPPPRTPVAPEAPPSAPTSRPTPTTAAAAAPVTPPTSAPPASSARPVRPSLPAPAHPPPPPPPHPPPSPLHPAHPPSDIHTAPGVARPLGQQSASGRSAPPATPNACSPNGGTAFCTAFATDPHNCGTCGNVCGQGANA